MSRSTSTHKPHTRCPQSRTARRTDRAAGLVALTAALLLAGCSSSDSGIDASLAFSPKQPIPGRPFDVTIATVSGAAATVTLRSADGTTTTTAEASVEDGVLIARGLQADAAGLWTVTAEVTAGSDATTAVADLNMLCAGTGTAGAVCCAATDCSSGLACVYGTCVAEAAPVDGRCFAGDECKEGVCDDTFCAAPSCDDGVANGAEIATDCGGTCGGCPQGVACIADNDCASSACVEGVCDITPGGLLGDGGDVGYVSITHPAMTNPGDLAFSPHTGALWVATRTTDTLVVVRNAGTAAEEYVVMPDLSNHFLENVVAIAFDPTKWMATCGDSRNTYAGQRMANDFMGPALWPDNVDEFFDHAYSPQWPGFSAHGAHLDMLHSSPRCMGIESDGNLGWFVFNGLDNTIDWYDFGEPHPHGGDDHSDGVKRRYPNVGLSRVDMVPSNLEWDATEEVLYMADTGNGRVLRLDPSTATPSGQPPFSDGGKAFPGDGTLTAMPGYDLRQAVLPGTVQQPSGLAIRGDVLYVVDHATSVIYAFDKAGNQLDSLQTPYGPNRLGGLEVGPDDRLYVVDMVGNQVLKITLPMDNASN